MTRRPPLPHSPQHRRRAQVVAQAARIGIPASDPFPEFVEAGGLMSYGIRIAQTILLRTDRVISGSAAAP